MCAESGRTTETQWPWCTECVHHSATLRTAPGRQAERGQFHFLRSFLKLSRTTSSQMASLSDLNMFQSLERGNSGPSGWRCQPHLCCL
ncbi:hypothetical protein PanWU01x14_324050 [Parasponia andersonii]|uniref:Uncharacterized protein n=1 Tax=Parasponia andersonii TaxID=3476 RepID=A0A2P5AK89_PARAD|nr:hypothetical protein PanWU01x14_324050 [Parasponia andersonii]